MLFSCGPATPAAPLAPRATNAAQSSAEVVYGDDDRYDVYAHPDEALRTLAQRSIAAMVSVGDIDLRNPNDVQLRSATLGELFGLCADQRFLNDPTAADCSGTLIGPDLVLTAGHCVTDARSCAENRWVFNYYRDSATALHPITRDDVFSCAEVLVNRMASFSGRSIDITILRLDRPATPRFTPVTVRRTATALAVNTPLAVIGFGSGVPAKIDSGGRVVDPRAASTDFFLATLDTFGGNSGSGVFDLGTRELVGVLSSGEEDYVRRGSCNVVNVCDSSCSGEVSTYAYNALALLCASRPDLTVCTGSTGCGDGTCSSDESAARCPSDCGPRPPMVPSSWVCDPSYYGVGDDCDCGCGAYDPDCANPALRVLNCRRGQVCSSSGTCQTPTTDAGTSGPEPTPSDAGSEDAGEDAIVGDAATGESSAPPRPGGCACTVAEGPVHQREGATAIAALGLAAGVVLVRARRRGARQR